MHTVCVTGAGGMTGTVTALRFLEAGYRVIGADIAPEPPSLPVRWSNPDFTYVRCDLTDYGDAVDLLRDVDAVVHLANVPAPGLVPAARTMHVNTAMNSNVFLAAAQLGLGRVVWASSETTLGLDFDEENRPRYLPVDEDHFPYPRSTYALSKVVGETTARHVSEWSGIPFVALRLSNVITEAAYRGFPAAWAEETARRFNLWSYIDVRDAADAFLLALTARVEGATEFIIAAPDSVMPVPTAELVARWYPDVEVRRPLEGFESLLSSARAQESLGFRPSRSWRDHGGGPQAGLPRG